jgi:excisionase family DNA binding protein
LERALTAYFRSPAKGGAMSTHIQPVLVSIDEAAKRFDVSTDTVRRRVAQGRLTVFLDGRDRRRRLVSLEQLEQLLKPRPLERVA